MAEGVNIGTAYVSIIPDGSRIGPEVKKSFGAVDTEAARAGQTSGKKFGGMFSRNSTAGADQAGARAGKRFGGLFSSTATKVIGAAGGVLAVSKLTNFLGDSLDEAREAAEVGRRTNGVIKSMGNASKISAKQVGDLSTAISNRVGVDDEAIQSGANLLLTFGKVRNETGKGNKVFNRATRLMADMSAAMGTDMKGSAIQLGKALNDPIKGMSALTRVGVSFTEAQKQTVKSLIEGGEKNAVFAMGLVENNEAWSDALKANKGDIEKTVKVLTKNLTDQQQKRFDFLAEGGHQLAAQKIILGEVSKQFKGAGAQMADPAKKLSVAYGNLKEQIGTALLPTVQNLEKYMTNKVIPAVSNFLDEMQTGKGRGGQAVQLFKDIRENAEKAWGFIRKIGKGFNDLPDPLKKGLLIGAAGAVVAKKTGLIGGGGLRGSTPLTPVFVRNVGPGGALGGAAGRGPNAVPAAPVVAGATAVGVGSYFETRSLLRRIGAGKAPVGDLLEIKKALEKSNVGEYADKFRIDIDRLSDDIARFGERGKYYKRVLKELANAGSLGGGVAGTLIPGLTTNTERAENVYADLRKIGQNAEDAANKAVGGARRAARETVGWKSTIIDTGREFDRLGMKHPRVSLESNIRGVQREFLDAGGKIDAIARKRRKITIGDNFPTIFDGLARIGRQLDSLTERRARLRLAISSGGTGFGTQRASGGPAYAGQQYTWNEHLSGLREQFVPAVDGRILSKRDAMAALAGGGGSSGPVFHIDKLMPHDYNDFIREAQSRAERAQMGGF